MRITRANLEAAIGALNASLSRPAEAWLKCADGSHAAQLGNFHLDHNACGWAVNEMVSEGGGVRCPFGTGHPAAEMLSIIRAATTGAKLGKREAGRAVAAVEREGAL